jgi:epsin
MDDLKKGLSNISLYDVKAYVRKAQNVVYNYTEMEARVREATNNEPWGASSTLMQQIAAGTYNYREREEIVGMIFRRFTEKAANEWRQIYKSLQLLEYLLKNGSERFVDDTRSNVSLIQMLRSFHYIDSHGRDQGINVRNKSKTLVDLLNNDSVLRAERKKARENAKKFKGVAGGASVGSNGYDSTGEPEDYDTYEGRIFGDGGVYGERFEETRAANKKNNFEEYDIGTKSKPAPVAKPEQKKQPDADLFSFDDPPTSSSAAPANDDEFDEFGDFQSSEVTSPQQQQPLNNIGNLNNLYHQQQPATTNSTSNTDSAFGDFNSFVSSAPTSQPQYSSNFNNITTSGPAVAQTKQDAFSSLFSTAASKAHANPKPKATPQASHATPVSQSNTSKPSNGELNLLDF